MCCWAWDMMAEPCSFFSPVSLLSLCPGKMTWFRSEFEAFDGDIWIFFSLDWLLGSWQGRNSAQFLNCFILDADSSQLGPGRTLKLQRYNIIATQHSAL